MNITTKRSAIAILSVALGAALNVVALTGSASAATRTPMNYDRNRDGIGDVQFSDTNGDGRYDLVQFDQNFDRIWDGLVSDTNRDGIWDTYMADPDQNGWDQVIGVDLDGDLRIDEYFVDVDQDHRFEHHFYDRNHNGVPDSNEPTGPAPATSFGDAAVAAATLGSPSLVDSMIRAAAGSGWGYMQTPGLYSPYH